MFDLLEFISGGRGGRDLSFFYMQIPNFPFVKDSVFSSISIFGFCQKPCSCYVYRYLGPQFYLICVVLYQYNDDPVVEPVVRCGDTSSSFLLLFRIV